MPPAVVPNHHADHPGFSGIGGLLMGLTMVPGRSSVTDVAIDLAGVGPGDRVVDIGCGPGSSARRAAKRGAQVTGVDPADVMLRLARVADRRRSVTWVQGVAEALPLPDDSATVVWSIASVHHWPDIDGGLSEIRRVLSPGGRLVALERRIKEGATGLASHGWTVEHAEAFAERCRTTGFEGVRVERRRTGRFGRQVAVVARAS